MRIRRFVLVAIAAASIAPFARGNAPVTHAQETLNIPYGVASETYYTADTANGRLSVKVHGEYINLQSPDLTSIPIWIMPGAENVVVTAEGQQLALQIKPGSEAEGVSGRADATLPRPLKFNTRMTIEATYEVPPRTGGLLMTLEPGLIETPFIGQGPGSFVLVDVPQSGDNYLDPGCLFAADQPADVKSAGRERWVCGEVTLIALHADDPDVVRQCAGMADKCRQRATISTFSAYMQSVTDPSKLGKLEGDVVMPDGRNVHMTLKYFKREQAWADRQWDLAQKSFPKLEGLFGHPYPLHHVNLRQSHHLEGIGAAGLAYHGGGEVLLAAGSGTDDSTTIHELAHQWSAYEQFESSFMTEGLAIYAAAVVGPEFGVQPRDYGWEAVPVELSLLTWQNDLGPLAQYYYGRSGAFWHAYEAAIGGRENMTAVLARIDDEPSLWRLPAGWFMDQGEWVSGKNLDALFLEWVFNPVTAANLLTERRAAHDSVRALQDRAAGLQLYGMPSDIYDNLLAWVFDPVAGQVDRAHKVLDKYQEVLTLSTEAGLGAPEGVAKSWGTKKVSETESVIEVQRQAILAIGEAAKSLAEEPEGSAPQQLLTKARRLYSEGDYSGAKAAAGEGVTAAFNEVAAVKMIEIAKEKQKEFSPNFFGRIGMFFTDPEKQLADAEAALEAGDGTSALKLSRSAYDTWDGASQRGIQRLAVCAGLMCGLTFLVWFLLRRLDTPSGPKKATVGHYLEDPRERRSSWRDWENTP